jgi:hypothetical protein
VRTGAEATETGRGLLPRYTVTGTTRVTGCPGCACLRAAALWARMASVRAGSGLTHYQAHYNTARPHQGIAQRAPADERDVPRATLTDVDTRQIRENLSWAA